MMQPTNKTFRYRQSLFWSAFLCFIFIVIAAPSAHARDFTKDELKIIANVNNYLNGFRDLEGHFVQVGPTGKYTSGRFYLSRPGRIRFEYEPPSPLLIRADGSWISIENRLLKTSEHYPLNSTPLNILLADKIDILKTAAITHAFQDDKVITLTLHDKASAKNGQLTLVFDAEKITLKEWVVVDGQGYQTRISVSDLITGIKQNPSLFYIEKPEFPENEQ